MEEWQYYPKGPVLDACCFYVKVQVCLLIIQIIGLTVTPQMEQNNPVHMGRGVGSSCVFSG